jgi:DnaJ domain
VPTHYDVLGVAVDADTETVRRAYVAVAKSSHPDRRQTDDPARRARADERIRAANAAWNELRDPARRAAYDRTLGSQRSPQDAGPAPRRSTPAPGPTAMPGEQPSGIVVEQRYAGLARYGPIVVILAVLVGVLVFSAYATSKDASVTSGGPSSDGRVAAPEVGDCVLVAVISADRVPVPVACGTQGSAPVREVVDSPRPCPPGTSELDMADAKTRLCLGPSS